MNTDTIISVLERILSEKYGQEVKLVAKRGCEAD
jgi:hypothetical protein